MKRSTTRRTWSLLLAAFLGIAGMQAQAPGPLTLYCTPGTRNLAGSFSGILPDFPPPVIRSIPASSASSFPGLRGDLALVDQTVVNSWQTEPENRILVGRLVLVPVMHASHPLRARILETGMTRDDLRRILSDENGPGTGLAMSARAHAYLPDGPETTLLLSEYLGWNPSLLSGAKETEEAGLLEKMSADPLSIGFCSLASLQRFLSTTQTNTLFLVPIDADGNGTLDRMEKDCMDANALGHAVFLGKYPDELTRDLFLVSANGFDDPKVRTISMALLEMDPDRFAAAGMNRPEYPELRRSLAQLQPKPPVAAPEEIARPYTGPLLALVGLLAIVSLAGIALSQGRNRRTVIIPPFPAGNLPLLSPDARTLPIPAGLLLDQSHTWLFMETSGRVRIGLDGFLQQMTGPLTRIQAPPPGTVLKRGDVLATLVQDGKRLMIRSPLSGELKEENPALRKDLSLLLSDPYEKGWILSLDPTRWERERRHFMWGEERLLWWKEQQTRMKEFLNRILQPEGGTKNALVYQDGGELRAGVLGHCGPEVWEEFQAFYLKQID
ncbi:MAG: hypothetical protein R2751_08820 [Bacteroidales bacterium]